MARKAAAPLTAAAVRHAAAGTHQDGGGLMLVVSATGSARWMCRFQLAGRRRDMGLGPARGPGAVSLAAAREKAAEARRLVQAGTDPLEARRAAGEAQAASVAAAAEAARAAAHTFETVARDYIVSHEAGWKNAKHAAQWTATLEAHAFPHVGQTPVADVGTEDVLAVLRPIWTLLPETASRVRGRMESILGFAKVQGWREGENPARWRGHLDHLLPRRSKVRGVAHHAALPWQQMPRFWRALRRKPGNGAAALRLAILTAARSGEVRGMTWREVNLTDRVWTVPVERMKAGREHRAPLSGAALALLLDQLPDDDGQPDADALVFPGQRQGKPLSDMTLSVLVRGMATDGLKEGEPPRWRDATGRIPVPHGFRSSFRDWCGEATSHPREVVEAALAHTLESKTEAAYRRGDAFEKRRALMADWAAFLAGEVTS